VTRARTDRHRSRGGHWTANRRRHERGGRRQPFQLPRQRLCGVDLRAEVRRTIKSIAHPVDDGPKHPGAHDDDVQFSAVRRDRLPQNRDSASARSISSARTASRRFVQRDDGHDLFIIVDGSSPNNMNSDGPYTLSISVRRQIDVRQSSCTTSLSTNGKALTRRKDPIDGEGSEFATAFKVADLNAPAAGRPTGRRQVPARCQSPGRSAPHKQRRHGPNARIFKEIAPVSFDVPPRDYRSLDLECCDGCHGWKSSTSLHAHVYRQHDGPHRGRSTTMDPNAHGSNQVRPQDRAHTLKTGFLTTSSNTMVGIDFEARKPSTR